MKTPFSSVVPPPLPPPPNNVAIHFLDVYLFPTLKKGEGEATFHKGREENLHLGTKVGNFHVSQQLLSMIVAKISGAITKCGNLELYYLVFVHGCRAYPHCDVLHLENYWLLGIS